MSAKHIRSRERTHRRLARETLMTEHGTSTLDTPSATMGHGNTKVIAAKRSLREKALSTAPAFHLDPHQAFLNATAAEIVDRIERGEWTASQVLEAYIARAAVAHAATNCITEVLFAEAREEAWALDKEFVTTNQLRGPLHGVPCSVKDQYDITGFDSTIGFTEWANKPSSNDAFLVSQLRAAGAVIIAKTNVPQTMLAFECANPLWGRTTNPWNSRYTCGGSSGGEAALLATDGSAMGLGSDTGGSLRIPAAYCGVYSLKPSFERICGDGAVGPVPGFEAVKTAFGPLARSVQDLEMFCRFMFGRQDPSSQISPLPYRDVRLPSTLRFGYYTSDGLMKASPANRRAVLETVEALRKQGHECIEFDPLIASDVFKTFVSLVTADGYETMFSHLGPDQKERSMFLVTIGPQIPEPLHSLVGWFIQYVLGDPVFADVWSVARRKSTKEFVKCTEQRDKLFRRWYKEVWNKYDFDGIIAPVQAVPCVPHGATAYVSPLSCGTVLYNVIESPAGIIPVTRVDPLKDGLTDEWTTNNKVGSWIMNSQVFSGPNPVYNPEAMEGLPVGVQIVGRHWEDEKVIAMMHVVDKALGPRGFGPGSWRG